MKDALGNNIVIGDTYGASYSSGGTHVKLVGKAIKVNKTKTTLCIESGEYIERYTTEWRNLEVGSNKPIQHDRLFPVHLESESSKLVKEVMSYYTEKIFDDLDVTVIDVIRHNNPKLVSDLENALRELIK